MATLATLIGALPWVGLLVYEASTSLTQSPLAGPAAGSFFDRIGVGISYGLPVAAEPPAFSVSLPRPPRIVHRRMQPEQLTTSFPGPH